MTRPCPAPVDAADPANDIVLEAGLESFPASDPPAWPRANEAIGATAGRARVPLSARLRPGVRVRVMEQIAHVGGDWTTSVEGTIVAYGQAPTGAWFAHGRDHRLWLDRLTLRADDGEITTCNLDDQSRIEFLDDVGDRARATDHSARDAPGPPGAPTAGTAEDPPATPAREDALFIFARWVMGVTMVLSFVLTVILVILPAAKPLFPAMAFVFSYAIWSLLRRRDHGTPDTGVRPTDPEIDVEHPPDAETIQAMRARGFRSGLATVVRLVGLTVLVTGTLFDWSIAVLGALVLLAFMLFAGAPVWLAAGEEDEEDELERHHYRPPAIR